jgi:IS30 family transposase
MAGSRFPTPVHFAVLTESEVREIRRRYRAGEPARAIATDLGRNLWTVRGVAYGRRNWQHVADLEPEALQATSQIVSLSERRLRQTDPDGGQAA